MKLLRITIICLLLIPFLCIAKGESNYSNNSGFLLSEQITNISGRWNLMAQGISEGCTEHTPCQTNPPYFCGSNICGSFEMGDTNIYVSQLDSTLYASEEDMNGNSFTLNGFISGNSVTFTIYGVGITPGIGPATTTYTGTINGDTISGNISGCASWAYVNTSGDSLIETATWTGTFICVYTPIYSQSNNWQITIVDKSSMVGGYISSCIDSNNRLHVSYYDYSNGNLKYATNESGDWNTYTIDSTGDVGQYTSIAVDSNNKIHISYFDYTNLSLKYTTNESGDWIIYTIDDKSSGVVGTYSSITIDNNNKAHISYYDHSGYLKYAKNISGSWVTSFIESVGFISGQGFYTSIAKDYNNKLHISYFSFTNSDLKYATNESGDWITYTIDSTGDVGLYSSIAVDSENKIHIACLDWTNKDLKYMTNKSGVWTTSTIDSIDDVGRYSSIKIDSNNKVHISYMNYTNSDLLYITNQSGGWIKDTVESLDDVGRFSSIALDAGNNVHICYYDATKSYLKYANSTLSTIIKNEIDFPYQFVLKQNYPNPFNPVTTITFSLPERSFVSLKVFDALGREVSNLISGQLPAGTYSRQWNASGLASGIYFYCLQVGNFIETKKLVLLR